MPNEPMSRERIAEIAANEKYWCGSPEAPELARRLLAAEAAVAKQEQLTIEWQDAYKDEFRCSKKAEAALASAIEVKEAQSATIRQYQQTGVALGSDLDALELSYKDLREYSAENLRESLEALERTIAERYAATKRAEIAERECARLKCKLQDLSDQSAVDCL